MALNSNRRILLILGSIFLVGVGFLFGRLTNSDPELRNPDANPMTSEPEAGVGPRRLHSGVPVGYARTEDGALQAALTYSRVLGPDPGESKDTYASKLRAIASDKWDPQSTIDSWELGEAEAAPIRFRLTAYSPQRAEVVLWFASFVNPRNGSPGSVWGRAFLTLVWENQDWKIAAEDGDAGPWPEPLSKSSATSDFTRLLDGFKAIEHEPASLP